MSIRYVFNRNLNLKCLWVKYLVQRKICRHLSIKSLKYDNCPNVRGCSNILVADNCLLHNTNTTTTVFPSWKWLLAISLLYAGYDSESELKIIIIAFAILNHFILLILPQIDICSIHIVNKMLKIIISGY